MPVGSGVLHSLAERSSVLPHLNKHLTLFAKRDFTEGCRDLAARMGNVSLVSFPEMTEQTG